ncbi:MAG: radical SAM family heme chaperone HemW [Candidatus Dormibacteria bacterium]
MKPRSLYLHIPFCVSKCPYCDFNSHVGLEDLMESYNLALVDEVQAWGRELDHPELDTVFIGGGTPSRVPGEHIAALMDGVRAAFNLAPGAEVTIEANPQSAEAERMDAWLGAGVNRLSLGFQSLDPQTLAFLERAHDADEATAVYRRARAAGFENINCDLIFAVPGLPTPRWHAVLDSVLALEPDHVSAYELTPEAGTRLGADVAAGITMMPGEEARIEQYALADEVLGAAGLHRYEVSNWARPGRECRHNVAYWSGVPYAAAGAGAHAYLRLPDAPSWLPSMEADPATIAVRQWNVSNPVAYVDAIRGRGNALGGHEWSDLEGALVELVMMGLRRETGIELSHARAAFGVDLCDIFAEPISRLRQRRLLELDDGHLRPTPRGRLALNTVVLEFLPARQPA